MYAKRATAYMLRICVCKWYCKSLLWKYYMFFRYVWYLKCIVYRKKWKKFVKREKTWKIREMPYRTIRRSNVLVFDFDSWTSTPTTVHEVIGTRRWFDLKIRQVWQWTASWFQIGSGIIFRQWDTEITVIEMGFNWFLSVHYAPKTFKMWS